MHKLFQTASEWQWKLVLGVSDSFLKSKCTNAQHEHTQRRMQKRLITAVSDLVKTDVFGALCNLDNNNRYNTSPKITLYQYVSLTKLSSTVWRAANKLWNKFAYV